MLRIYYDYYIKSLKHKLDINKGKADSFKEQKDAIELEIINFYVNTKYTQEDFLKALKTKTLIKANFNNEMYYESLRLKLADLKVVRDEYRKYQKIVDLATKLNISYKVFGFIVDDFLIELRDEFIKGNICVFKLPFFGTMCITLKYPKARISKKTGNAIYPISWVKSKKYKEELIAKGIKVREKGETDGENWLLPMSEPYPIIRWFKAPMLGTPYFKKLCNLVFKPGHGFITDLYLYLEKQPDTKRKYETVGNHYLNTILLWMQQRQLQREVL